MPWRGTAPTWIAFREKWWWKNQKIIPCRDELKETRYFVWKHGDPGKKFISWSSPRQCILLFYSWKLQLDQHYLFVFVGPDLELGWLRGALSLVSRWAQDKIGVPSPVGLVEDDFAVVNKKLKFKKKIGIRQNSSLYRVWEEVGTRQGMCIGSLSFFYCDNP